MGPFADVAAGLTRGWPGCRSAVPISARPPNRAAGGVMSAALLGVVLLSAPAAYATAPSWSVVKSPNKGSGGSGLNAVSCSSGTSCVAVGAYEGAHAFQTLVESWNGKAWLITPSPNVGTGSNELAGVSCLSTKFCMAVGFYNKNNASPYRTLIESWNGKSWAVVSSPNNGSGASQLAAVSCVSTAWCMAVGTLTELWNGRSWSTGPTVGFTPTALSCRSSSFCMAVGDEFSFNRYQTVTATWNGKSWSTVRGPNVNGQSGQDNYLYGVSCPAASTTSCVTVGEYVSCNSSTCSDQVLIASWKANTWTLEASHDSNSGQLSAVACFSATSCQAVGVNTTGSPPVPLTETWNGTVWSVVSAHNNSLSELAAVSCVSANSCKAVGDYENGVSADRTLIESYG